MTDPCKEKTASFQAFQDVLFRHPGRLVGGAGAAADASMALSGLVFENVGRSLSGAFGLAGNIPLVFFAEMRLPEGEIDPQDLPFRQKVRHIWKFWKYPYEFAALTNIAQTIGIALLSGPDSASVVGEHAHIQQLISDDSFRPMETLMGMGGMAAVGIAFIREAERIDAVPARQAGVIPSLKRDFNAVAGFMRNRGADLYAEGARFDRGLIRAFDHGCLEIAIAGPNKVAAKIWNVLIYPWVIESVLHGDWANVGAACFYRGCNYFYERASKRAVPTAQPQA